MSFIKNLQKNMNKVTAGYFVNWTPEMPVAVGDYGDINGYRFTRDGNLGRYLDRLEIDAVRSETATFEKKDGLVVRKGGAAKAGAATLGKAILSLEFGSEGSFLYHLKSLTNLQFKQRRDAFEQIGKLILSERINWRDDYVLVTEVKEAGRAFILVADSANAEMELECTYDESLPLNLASVSGGVNYARDSDRVIRYEIEQNTPVLFRLVSFTRVPPGGGPDSSIGLAKLRSWFGDKLPQPDSIYLYDYVQDADVAEGTFSIPGGEPITLRQKTEDIESFIQKSERDRALDQLEDIDIEEVPLRRYQQHG